MADGEAEMRRAPREPSIADYAVGVVMTLNPACQTDRYLDELEAGELYEPGATRVIFWTCQIRDPEGRPMTEGQAESAGAAMAMAWVSCWAPDAVCLIGDDGDGGFDQVPL